MGHAWWRRAQGPGGSMIAIVFCAGLTAMAMAAYYLGWVD